MNEKEKAVMPRRLEQIVNTCRLLSVDSQPDGWPAIQMKDITTLCDAIETLEALVAAQDVYLNLLGDEIDGLAVFAHVHGWRSQRHEEGKVCRGTIAELRTNVFGC